MLAAAGLSDVLDGWFARRRRPPDGGGRHLGEWLDPLCDKIFVAAVMVGVTLAYRPPLVFVLLTVTREFLQVVSFTVYKLVPCLREAISYSYRAHVLGKATTVSQFLASAAFVLEHAAAPPLACLSALLGIVTVAVYLGRARRLARASGKG